jgi:Lon-like protease
VGGKTARSVAVCSPLPSKSPSSTPIRLPTPLRIRRPRRWPVVLFVAVILVAVLIIASVFVTVSYFSLVPGYAQPVSPLISVPKDKATPPNGHLLLTDVGVDNVSLFGLTLEKVKSGLGVSSDTTIVPQVELTGNLPVSQFNAQGTVDMEESELTAKAVALRQLGYSVPETDVGATVYVIDPGSPASRSLQIGDVITSVDGTPTPNPHALQSAVRSHHPGDTVTLQVGSISKPFPGRSVSVRLGKTVENGQTVPFLGIGDPSVPIPGMGTQPYYQFPFPVSINSDQIGGPSAGLAWTLGIIDKLSGGGLTAKRTVAATGTIDPDGGVGDVGGVAQKTVAVEQAGATVFFVPVQELSAARSQTKPNLRIFAVSSLSQALQDLEHLGGDLGSAANGPPAGPGGNSVPYEWKDSPWS